MARRILIQERVNEPSDLSFRVVYWIAVPTTQQAYYADAAFESMVADVTAGELQDLRDGKFVEVSQTMEFPSGTAVAALKTALLAEGTRLQAVQDALNPWKYFGSYWDTSTGWNMGGAS